MLYIYWNSFKNDRLSVVLMTEAAVSLSQIQDFAFSENRHIVSTMGEVVKSGKAQKNKKNKPARALLESVSEDGSSSFAKALGSVDFQTREKGLQALTVYLSRSSQLSKLAMRKLWKGIFYCFWHSDKAPTQVNIDVVIIKFAVTSNLLKRHSPGGKMPLQC
jgi:hypothetical protein